MLMKSYSKTGGRCRVTFKVEGEAAATSVTLCGEFNNWDPGVSPMKQLKGGGVESYPLTRLGSGIPLPVLGRWGALGERCRSR